MFRAYKVTANGMVALADSAGVGAEAVWVDLIQPTAEEEKAAESFLGADLPTREETQEIEYSSRLYSQGGAVYLTASVLTGVEIGAPHLVPFTLVATDARLATLRYDELRAHRQFLARAMRPDSGCGSVPGIFLGLIEAIVDRTADVLERLGLEVDRLNTAIFSGQRKSRQRAPDLEALVGDIGAQGDVAAKARESLASVERLVQFAAVTLPAPYVKGSSRDRLKLLGRDIRSLEDHVTFLSSKINFLLDATLGLISVQQNEVIRVLTVAATIFFPPTLIGTIYGMNFVDMPELRWGLGYPFAVGVMVLSAVIPYVYFKRRGWL